MLAEVDTAYQGQCPRGRSHVLHILHLGGRWRLFCTKGCSEGDILKAIGRPPDLLRHRPPAEPRPLKELVFDYPTFAMVRRLDVPDDAAGKHRYYVRLDGRRLKPQEVPSWCKGVVYRLAELQRASIDEPVFWCEGERDVEALRRHGLTAVTTSCGAHNFEPSKATTHFRGRWVVILPDNDEPGRMYAERVANSLRGVAAKVHLVALPDLPPKGDVSWWLANGGKVEDLLKAARVPDFFKPVKAAPPPPKADRTKALLGTVEAAILAALHDAEHKSLTTDALPMLIAGLPGEEAWNSRAKEPIIRYRDVPRAGLAKARAGISRALGSLARRGLIEKTGRWVRLARSAPSRRA
jgi:5S rRNA maturation endonuclease (ribonuclease M5)